MERERRRRGRAVVSIVIEGSFCGACVCWVGWDRVVTARNVSIKARRDERLGRRGIGHTEGIRQLKYSSSRRQDG